MLKLNRSHPRSGGFGFTLVEVMLSMSVLVLLLMLVTNVISNAQRALSRTSAHVSQFREARKAFDTIKKYLSQATLNTYLRYSYEGGGYSPFSSGGTESKNAAPTKYSSYSELQFVCGPSVRVMNSVPGVQIQNISGHAAFFQAPIGWSPTYANMPTLLNGRGYFVQFGDDLAIRPDFLSDKLPPKYRYRLMEYAPSAELNRVYDATTAGTQSDWYQDVSTSSRPLATNIVALFFSPRRAMPVNGASKEVRDIAPNYYYDSSNDSGKYPYELPPIVDLIMVVIDERSAERLASRSESSPPLKIEGFVQATGTQIHDDLEMLESTLSKLKVNYRIFQAAVPLRNSKWAAQ